MWITLLAAVMIMPTPSAFVSIRTSPGRAPLFVRTLSGRTKPVTHRPYFGSSSKMLCPPAMTAPARRTMS